MPLTWMEIARTALDLGCTLQNLWRNASHKCWPMEYRQVHWMLSLNAWLHLAAGEMTIFPKAEKQTRMHLRQVIIHFLVLKKINFDHYLPNTKQLMHVIAIEINVIDLLPNARMITIIITLAKMPNTPSQTATVLGSTGDWYAINICVMYGRIENIPQNCAMKNINVNRINGNSVGRRKRSWIFSRNVYSARGHVLFCFSHSLQDWTEFLYFCKAKNSSITAGGSTQPRSHCNARIESSGRSLNKSHIGVSGTYICVWHQ